MFWFIVLLLVVGAGFYFYQKLISIEREIHAEQEAYTVALQKAEKTPEEVPEAKEPDPETTPAAVIPEQGEPTSLPSVRYSGMEFNPSPVVFTSCYRL